ncbi:hypothetical protein Dsin_001889 [Dipteronia sinensis]|uniref:Ribonuclease H n=1 Tax=Dipteronia sinensis TaxID=43782 RepID=A0AAE0B4U3_9ROSI|nr:hypothetical protein Dsin_001889 [Dipteronia sinensis]
MSDCSLISKLYLQIAIGTHSSLDGANQLYFCGATIISSKTENDLSLATIPRPNRTVPMPVNYFLGSGAFVIFDCHVINCETFKEDEIAIGTHSSLDGADQLYFCGAPIISSITEDDLSLGTIPRPNRTVPRPVNYFLGLGAFATFARHVINCDTFEEDEVSLGSCRPRKRYLSSVLYEMGKKFVYVVFKGRRTGVYNSWPECHEHIDGFPGASYQKFNSTDEAYKVISSRSGHSSHSWLESLVNVEEKESSVNVEEKVSEKNQSTGVMLFSFLFVFIFGVLVGKIV